MACCCGSALPLWAFQLTWPESLLLGSILSATDPVGVTDMFKQIGAPNLNEERALLSIPRRGSGSRRSSTESSTASPGLGRMVEGLRAGRTARDYEIAWARSRGSKRVLEELDDRALLDALRANIIEEVRAFYQFWHESARGCLDQTAEQFPEFVASTQERLADRLVLHAEQEAIEEKAHAGIIPEGVADAMLAEMAAELRDLRASQVSQLRIEPEEVLRKVPFFQGLPPVEFASVAARLRRRTAPAGEVIVRQGSTGDSLYLVARGVVRVSRQDGGLGRDLATLMAGDFFGETALLHGGRRTATCRAVTPCALYELRRVELDPVIAMSPPMREALEEADRRRSVERIESEESPARG